MNDTPALENELFQLAIQFIDQYHGLDSGANELNQWLTKKLVSCSNPDIRSDDSIRKFSGYIELLAYPSHLAVELLLKFDYIERALKMTETLTNALERKRSLVAMVNYFLKEDLYEKALSLIQELEPFDRHESLAKFVDVCLDKDLLSLLVTLTRRLSDQDEQLEIYKCAALNLAKRNRAAETLELLGRLKDSRGYSAVQSNVAQILADNGDIDAAEQLAPAIKDPGDREDAYNSILKALLSAHHEGDAIAFTDTIRNTDEKIRAAKFIEKIMLSQHNVKMVQTLRHRFAMPQITYKRAA